jgi:hypothetical protein
MCGRALRELAALRTPSRPDRRPRWSLQPEIALAARSACGARLGLSRLRRSRSRGRQNLFRRLPQRRHAMRQHRGSLARRWARKGSPRHPGAGNFPTAAGSPEKFADIRESTRLAIPASRSRPTRSPLSPAVRPHKLTWVAHIQCAQLRPTGGRPHSAAGPSGEQGTDDEDRWVLPLWLHHLRS